jgi:alpha-1,3-glucosyltransferase
MTLHYRYNSFMLGLCLVALTCFQHSHDALGAIAFSSCILFKQMGLYWSPAVFAYLLGKCIWLGGERGVLLLVKIGVATVVTFGIMFAPFLTPFPDLPMYVLHRIFPLARGKSRHR